MKDAYEGLWRELIEPARFAYCAEDLGPESELVDGAEVLREDFEVLNADGFRLACSLFRPAALPAHPLDMVVYLHARGGGRLEALFLKRIFLPAKLLLVFDYAGSGASEGQYITLGVKEAQDARRVIDAARGMQPVRRIALWGRSMGAVAAILLAGEPANAGLVQCLVLDSPFASFRGMVYDVIYARAAVPKCSINLVLRVVMATIQKRTKVAVEEIDPLRVLEGLAVPGFFLVGLQDQIARPDRVKDLYLTLRTHLKEYHVVPGEHASPRGTNVILAAVLFVLRCFEAP